MKKKSAIQVASSLQQDYRRRMITMVCTHFTG